MSTATLLRPTTAPPGALRLLVAGRRALGEADASVDPLERYAFAHLAALRAAAAVLADRARPMGTRARRPTSVWTLLAGVAPEMTPWAEFFAAGANKRAGAEAGLRGAVTRREADDLMRDAGAFIALVETALGMLTLPAAAGDGPPQ
jgi:SAV_6107-like HEPN